MQDPIESMAYALMHGNPNEAIKFFTDLAYSEDEDQVAYLANAIQNNQSIDTISILLFVCKANVQLRQQFYLDHPQILNQLIQMLFHTLTHGSDRLPRLSATTLARIACVYSDKPLCESIIESLVMLIDDEYAARTLSFITSGTALPPAIALAMFETLFDHFQRKDTTSKTKILIIKIITPQSDTLLPELSDEQFYAYFDTLIVCVQSPEFKHAVYSFFFCALSTTSPRIESLIDPIMNLTTSDLMDAKTIMDIHPIIGTINQLSLLASGSDTSEYVEALINVFQQFFPNTFPGSTCYIIDPISISIIQCINEDFLHDCLGLVGDSINSEVPAVRCLSLLFIHASSHYEDMPQVLDDFQYAVLALLNDDNLYILHVAMRFLHEIQTRDLLLPFYDSVLAIASSFEEPIFDEALSVIEKFGKFDEDDMPVITQDLFDILNNVDDERKATVMSVLVHLIQTFPSQFMQLPTISEFLEFFLSTTNFDLQDEVLILVSILIKVDERPFDPNQVNAFIDHISESDSFPINCRHVITALSVRFQEFLSEGFRHLIWALYNTDNVSYPRQLLESINSLLELPLDDPRDLVHDIIAFGSDGLEFRDQALKIEGLCHVLKYYPALFEDIFDFVYDLSLTMDGLAHEQVDCLDTSLRYFIDFLKIMLEKYSGFVDERWLHFGSILFRVSALFNGKSGLQDLIKPIFGLFKAILKGGYHE